MPEHKKKNPKAYTKKSPTEKRIVKLTDTALKRKSADKKKKTMRIKTLFKYILTSSITKQACHVQYLHVL